MNPINAVSARDVPQKMHSEPARIVVLISGTGRNLQAIIDGCQSGQINGHVVAVISNRPGVLGLERARQAGIPTCLVDHKTFVDRESFDTVLSETIRRYTPDIVALAGFMRILTPGFIERFAGKLVNIHPSLLPKYRGLNTYARAIEAGDTEAGASVHFVTPELDGGPVIMQGKTAIHPADSALQLADRVMNEVELALYPAALALIANGQISLIDDAICFENKVLDAPIQL